MQTKQITKWSRIAAAILFAFIVSACNVTVPDMDNKFGKQNFVSAIAMIELHKTRYGSYPDTLKDLHYLGDWDQLWLSSVKYEKVEGGYNLYLQRGWVGKPTLDMPAGFKQNLGLKNSSVRWVAG